MDGPRIFLGHLATTRPTHHLPAPTPCSIDPLQFRPFHPRGDWPMRVRRRVRVLGLLAIAPTVLSLGCGGGADVTVGPDLGTLEISTTTSGPEPDADGYTVS